MWAIRKVSPKGAMVGGAMVGGAFLGMAAFIVFNYFVGKQPVRPKRNLRQEDLSWAKK